MLVLFVDEHQFLQLSFLFLVSAYTATWAGVLVYVVKNMSKKKKSLHFDKQNYENKDENEISSDEKDNSESLELNNSKFKKLSTEKEKSLIYSNIMLILLLNSDAI